jgi:hypothetical protein
LHFAQTLAIESHALFRQPDALRRRAFFALLRSRQIVL